MISLFISTGKVLSFVYEFFYREEAEEYFHRIAQAGWLGIIHNGDERSVIKPRYYNPLWLNASFSWEQDNV